MTGWTAAWTRAGRPYYWIGGDAPTGIPDEGTDFGAVAEGCVSVTPLHLDLTAFRCDPARLEVVTV